MAYLSSRPEPLEWSSIRRIHCHPLREVWLTPLKTLAQLPQLGKRRRERRLESDDVEKDGTIPEVFSSPSDHTAISINTQKEDNFASSSSRSEDHAQQCDLSNLSHASGQTHRLNQLRRQTPTPPASPELSSKSHVGATYNNCGRSSKLCTITTAGHQSPPHQSSDAKLAHAGPAMVDVSMSQTPPVSPGVCRSENEISTTLSGRAATPPDIDPLKDWGYTNPKPSAQTPLQCKMDVNAFPIVTMLPKQCKNHATNGLGRSRLSPEQKAKAKQMLEGAVRWTSNEKETFSPKSDCSSRSTLSERVTSPHRAAATLLINYSHEGSDGTETLDHCDYGTYRLPGLEETEELSQVDHDAVASWNSIECSNNEEDSCRRPCDASSTDECFNDLPSLSAPTISQGPRDALAATNGMVAIPEDEEYSWGCRVSGATQFDYGATSTSLGWDGCYYGTATPIVGSSSACTSMGVIYDLV